MSAGMKLLVTNARIVDPASGRDEPGRIAIADGRITHVEQIADTHLFRQALGKAG